MLQKDFLKRRPRIFEGEKYVNSFLETLKQLGPVRLAVMTGILLSLFVFFIFVSMRVSSPSMELLYTDLSSIDSGAIAAKLEEAQIPYQISPNGSRIEVPGNEVGRARMLLAEAGLPNGGSMGYELFDKQSSFGTTNAVQNVNQVRALEGELARTIGSLDMVRSARVHLVLPRRELFSRQERASSASVAIQVRPGARLENDQILAIQSLVASAVPGLKAESVSIIDQNGTLLARGGEGSQSLASLKAEEMKLNYEARLTQTIEDLVGRTVGYGKVRATVTADLNFDRVSATEELFDPAGQVPRSTQTIEESNTERESGAENVSVENNLPGVDAGLFGGEEPSAESNRLEEVTNYEVSKTVRNTVREVGEVKRLSVAVLVDGFYTENEEGERTYQPRSEEQLDQISALVRSAIGFDANRGDTLEVVNMQFAEVETEDEALLADTLLGFDRNKLLDAAEVLMVAVMIILVVVLILQPMIGRILTTIERPEGEEDLETDLLAATGMSPALEAPASGAGPHTMEEEEEEDNLIDVQKVQGKVKASAVKKVEGIVENYPQETVSVLRGWMSQE